jgi:hypothetical protein
MGRVPLATSIEDSRPKRKIKCQPSRHSLDVSPVAAGTRWIVVIEKVGQWHHVLDGLQVPTDPTIACIALLVEVLDEVRQRSVKHAETGHLLRVMCLAGPHDNVEVLDSVSTSSKFEQRCDPVVRWRDRPLWSADVDIDFQLFKSWNRKGSKECRPSFGVLVPAKCVSGVFGVAVRAVINAEATNLLQILPWYVLDQVRHCGLGLDVEGVALVHQGNDFVGNSLAGKMKSGSAGCPLGLKPFNHEVVSKRLADSNFAAERGRHVQLRMQGARVLRQKRHDCGVSVDGKVIDLVSYFW